MELAAEKLLSLTILVSLQCLNQNRNLILKSFHVIFKVNQIVEFIKLKQISFPN